MGNYAMQELRNIAMRNFIKGIRNFKVFGNVDVLISVYDCTGKVFTVSLSVKRIPLGLSVVHHMSLDL